MKKIFYRILSLFLAVGFCTGCVISISSCSGCGSSQTPNSSSDGESNESSSEENSESENNGDNVMDTKHVNATYYNVENAVIPVWKTKTVVNETIAFKDKNDTAELMYTPTKIISVYDYYLNKQYFRGVDFTLEGKTIKLTEDTSAPYWNNYYSSEVQGSITLSTDKGYILYSEVIPNQYHLCVTYEHNDEWKGTTPQQTDELPNTLQKLSKGETLNIAVIGDSITVGAGASKYNKTNYPSYYTNMAYTTPSYVYIVHEYLQKKYKSAYDNTANQIYLENCAVGGTAVGSAVQHINNLTRIPDLAIIAYGMNHGGDTADMYKMKMQAAIQEIREKNSACEIILISTMLPNTEVTDWAFNGDIPLYEGKLFELAEAFHTAVVPMTSISKELYEKMGKRSIDMLSNAINHPTDFLHTIYAQAVLTVMLGDNYARETPDLENPKYNIGILPV